MRRDPLCSQRSGIFSTCAAVLTLAVGACRTGADPGPVPDQISVDALGSDSASIRCLGTQRDYDRRDEVEPHAAVDPADATHLVAAWMTQVRGRSGAIMASVSRDGGQTWSAAKVLPFNTCAGGSPGLPATSDPWVSIGVDGRVYVTAIGWLPGEYFDSASVVTSVTSSDGGDRWNEPVAVSESRTPTFMHDNTAVDSDRNIAGRAWVATTHWSVNGRPAAVSRTDDAGLHWSPLTFASPSFADAPASAPQPVVANGFTYVFYGHGRDGSQISFARSGDEGQTWSPAALVHEGPESEGELLFPGTEMEMSVAADIMHAAADPSTDDLYVVFTARSRVDTAPQAAVWLTASRDGGSSWSPPVAVGEPGEMTWRPTLAVAPGGPAYVSYFRAAAVEIGAAKSARSTEVLVRAFEWAEGDGLLAGPAESIDRFDWRPRANGSLFLGDYHGLVATEQGAVAVFSRSTPSGSRIVSRRAATP